MANDNDENECQSCALVDRIIALLSDDDQDPIEHLRALNTVTALILTNMTVTFFEDDATEVAQGNA